MAKFSNTIVPYVATIFLLVAYSSEAFTTASSSSSLRRLTSSTGSVALPSSFRLVLRASSSEDGDDDDMSSAVAGLPPLPSQGGGISKSSRVEDRSPVVTSAASSGNDASAEAREGEGAVYPIDLPSPLLLATSMILAISSTGSIFELAGGGTTKLGFGPTAALAAIGMPMSIFLIYAAIMKGAAETEEDDKEYNRPRRL